MNIQDDVLNSLGRRKNIDMTQLTMHLNFLWDVYIHINIYFWS